MEKKSCIFCEKRSDLDHLESCLVFKSLINKEILFPQVPSFHLKDFDRFKEIAVAVKILFCFEEIRFKVFQTFNGWDQRCSCLFCALRKVFSFILKGNSEDYKGSWDQSFECVENSGVVDVVDCVVIENVNDAFKFLFSYLKNEKCACRVDFFECFQFLVIENFKCSCGKMRTEEVFYFGIKVEISEIQDLGVSFFKVFQKQREKNVFNICGDMDCIEKKSKNFGVAIKAPLYLFLEVDCKLGYYEIMKQSINLEVKSSDLFTHKNQVRYRIYMICASNIDKTFVFLCFEDNWVDIETDLNCDLENMIFYLNSFHCKIDLIIYKQKPSISSEKLKKSQSPSPQKFLCRKCNTIKLDSSPGCKNCLDLKKNLGRCSICDQPYKNSSKICEDCENLKVFKKNLLQSNCPECSTPVINGQKCKTCLLKRKSEQSRPITASSPVHSILSPVKSKILCKKCSSPLESSKEECAMCKVPEETKAAIPLKGTSINNHIHPSQNTKIQPKVEEIITKLPIQANKLTEKPPNVPKRQGSALRNNNCEKCASKLSHSETRNCLHCKKTHSSYSGKCSYCGKVSYICDSCLKKLKKNKKKYALDLKNPIVLEFIETKGILKNELEVKKLKDFAEQGLSPEIQEARFKYHNEKLQVIQIQFKAFQARKTRPQTPKLDIEEDKSPQTLSPQITNIISKTPHTSKLELSQKSSPTYYANRSLKLTLSSEDRMEKIQKKMNSKIFMLKTTLDRKKLNQLKNLNEIELQREIKAQKILEKLEKNSENYLSKSSKHLENNMKKFDLVKQNLILKEKELENNIQKSLEKIDLKHKLASKRLELDLISKKNKAKSMAKSAVCDKSVLEEAQSEGKLQQLLKKFEKIKENKKRIQSTLQFNIKKKKEIEKNKKKNVMRKLKRYENEIKKKNLDIEKKLEKNFDKIVMEKAEKMKNLAVQNELEQLSAKTRIERINFKFNSYKNKLLEEHQSMSKRIDEFIVEKKKKDKKER